MNDSLSDLRARPHLSVSALKLFLQCPRKFNFQYIERAPADFRPVAFVFGTAWHATIGRWLTALPNVPPVSELRDWSSPGFVDIPGSVIAAGGVIHGKT